MVILDEKKVKIGDEDTVARMLPRIEARSVGPFVLIDHMGPVEVDNMVVLPHPHIGISTLTFLYEGASIHRDTMGAKQEIHPGEVNLMVSGSGCAHSERSLQTNQQMHGLQIWLALPEDQQDTDPAFFHIGKDQLPGWQQAGADFKLVLGEILGQKSPVPNHGEGYMLDVQTQTTTTLQAAEFTHEQHGVYVLNGSVKIDGNVINTLQMGLLEPESSTSIEISADTHVVFFGGKALAKRRHMWWNFVHTEREAIEKAKDRWRNQQFGQVAEETDFVPLPE